MPCGCFVLSVCVTSLCDVGNNDDGICRIASPVLCFLLSVFVTLLCDVGHNYDAICRIAAPVLCFLLSVFVTSLCDVENNDAPVLYFHFYNCTSGNNILYTKFLHNDKECLSREF